MHTSTLSPEQTKLLFLDLEGTLLNSVKGVPEKDRNAEAEAPAWAVQPMLSCRAGRWRAGLAGRHPSRPQRPATHSGHPNSASPPTLETATRRATRRPGYQHRRAMAVATRHRTLVPYELRSADVAAGNVFYTAGDLFIVLGRRLLQLMLKVAGACKQ